MQPKVSYSYLNGTSYQALWDIQTKIHKGLIATKLDLRDVVDKPKYTQSHQFLLCEHAPVYTLGKSGSMDHLLLTEDELADGRIEFFRINRGGDITYHGPGQITGYPILDLDEFFTDLHLYVRKLEQVIIDTIAHYDLKGTRIKEYTGVWLEPNENNPHYRKICAIGVHMSRWVSMHGFAFNVNTDLDYFRKIIPCGIVDEDKQVTSLQRELGRPLDMVEVGNELLTHFASNFSCELIQV